MSVFIASVGLLDTIRYELDMAYIYDLGLRAFVEYGAEVARRTDPAAVFAVARAFARLENAWVVAAGADRMVPRRLVLVP